MTPDEEAKADRQGSSLCVPGDAFAPCIRKIRFRRTVVLDIWTKKTGKRKQIFENVKEKMGKLQSVHKLNTNVRGRRLK